MINTFVTGEINIPESIFLHHSEDATTIGRLTIALQDRSQVDRLAVEIFKLSMKVA
jgi:hypothetical protein